MYGFYENITRLWLDFKKFLLCSLDMLVVAPHSGTQTSFPLWSVEKSPVSRFLFWWINLENKKNPGGVFPKPMKPVGRAERGVTQKTTTLPSSLPRIYWFKESPDRQALIFSLTQLFVASFGPEKCVGRILWTPYPTFSIQGCLRSIDPT